MKHHIERLRRAIWSYKQPLSRVPTIAGSPVSDLFLWRNSEEWETFFELMDLPALFAGPHSASGHVVMVFFDAAGNIFLEKTVEVTPGRRNTIALSNIVGNDHGVAGTFCVFHSHTPISLQVLGSNLAERGYVSYRYLNAPIRSYVHGNFDAITRLSDQSLQLLGGKSIRRREYNLQHELDLRFIYELGIINPTRKNQKIVCRTLAENGCQISCQSADLPPYGSHLFHITPENSNKRAVISSYLIMARPLVFSFKDKKMDVFHG